MTVRAALLAGLVALTVAAYARAPFLGFISVDDPGYVTENPQVQAGLTSAGVRWAFTTTAQSNWHPLTWLSLMLDASIGGASPAVYHVTNVVLHLLATLLLFAVFERTTGSPWRSAAVAALFAVHPLHVESVAWVSERKDVLSAAFWMLTMLLYARYAERPSIGRYAAVFASLALGLLAKPMLVTLPVILLLFDRWPLARLTRASWPRLVLEKVPLLVLSALSSWATLLAQRGAIRSIETFPLGERVLGALVAAVAYLAQTIWPAGLAAYYPYPSEPRPLAIPLLCALGLILATAAAIRWSRTLGWLALGWGWYLVALAPVIGIVQVGSQARADRYTYIPLVGIFVIVSWGAAALSSGRRRLLAAAAAATLVALAAATFVQVGHWRSSIDLFEHAVAVTDGNAVAHATLASALAKAGRGAAAREHMLQAMLAHRGFAEMQFMRARAAIGAGQLQEAAFLVGLELEAFPKDVRTLVNAGLLDMRHDRYDDAISRFEEALAADPDSLDAHLNLGSIRAAQGRLDEAIAHFEAAARVAPDDPDAARVLAELRSRKAGAP